MKIIYSNEDYMYHAYDLYNKIKINLNDENDENYICIYIDNTCSDIYYYNAIEKFGKYKKLIIIDDKGEWYNNNKNKYECIYKIDNKNKYLLLLLMSFYNNNILSNSLYSYFGGYLNKNNKEIVIVSNEINDSIKILEL